MTRAGLALSSSYLPVSETVHEMIVYQPGVTEPGSVCDEFVIIEDFFPTILELAGVEHTSNFNGHISGNGSWNEG